MPQKIEEQKPAQEKNEAQKKNITVLGQETEFDGEIEFTDNLVITGRFSGKINATGDLVVEKSAVCDVDFIKANSVVAYGKINGNIEAPERVEMCSGSEVHGDVVTGRIRVSDNVDFEGQVTMLKDIPDVDIFSVASEEFKSGLLLKSDMPH